jgi:hypothetical protein
MHCELNGTEIFQIFSLKIRRFPWLKPDLIGNEHFHTTVHKLERCQYIKYRAKCVKYKLYLQTTATTRNLKCRKNIIRI